MWARPWFTEGSRVAVGGTAGKKMFFFFVPLTLIAYHQSEDRRKVQEIERPTFHFLRLLYKAIKASLA